MEDEFKKILIDNNEDQLVEWTKNNGKKPKPVSPIYFFDDLSEENRKIEEEKYK